MARRKKPTDPQDMASIAERRDPFAERPDFKALYGEWMAE